MQSITPFLWFNGNAEDAMNFYLSVFKDSRVISVSRIGEGGPGGKGSVMSANFELNGQRFIALNGGPQYSFTPAISLFVNCESQQEIDTLWDRLSDGGEPGRCGWLTDRFGLSWQVVPTILGTLIGDKDRAKAGRALQAMLKMNKLDIAELQQAFDQG
jgi:predicted 3-demethylubiquinone-9 3-methyltransferase (glyoxalase superfamily)